MTDDDSFDWEQYRVENYPNEGTKRTRRGQLVDWLPEDYAETSGHRADPQPVVEKIRQKMARVGFTLDDGQPFEADLYWGSERDREHVKSLLEENSDESWTSDESLLPGFGPRGFGRTAQEDCGDPHPHVCTQCANHVDFGRTCAQSVCSRCAPAWCRDLATKKVAKLRQFRMVKEDNTTNGGGETDDEWQKFHHQVINPPLAWYYHLARAGYSIEEAQEETKEVVKWILDEMRCQGLVVRHSYRGRDDEDGELHEEADDRGFWKQILFEGKSFYGSDDGVRDRLAWRPHYHTITVSDWARGGGFTDALEEFTGWVTHRINHDGRSVESDGAMADAVTYTLSHGDIDVYDGRHNQSANWEVGSFQGQLPDGEGGPLRSTSRFSPSKGNLDWARVRVRKSAEEVLGLPDVTTECGAELPAVDDPDALAEEVLDQMRDIYDDLYPEDDGGDPVGDVPNDVVLHHISEGNIQVDFEGSASSWSVSVSDSWSPSAQLTDTAGDVPVGHRGSTSSSETSTGAGADVDDADGDETTDVDADDLGAESERCDGKLIPLEVARQRGLLEDEDWLASAPHADEALRAHEEYPDDLTPWKYSSVVWDGATG